MASTSKRQLPPPSKEAVKGGFVLVEGELWFDPVGNDICSKYITRHLSREMKEILQVKWRNDNEGESLYLLAIVKETNSLAYEYLIFRRLPSVVPCCPLLSQEIADEWLARALEHASKPPKKPKMKLRDIERRIQKNHNEFCGGQAMVVLLMLVAIATMIWFASVVIVSSIKEHQLDLYRKEEARDLEFATVITSLYDHQVSNFRELLQELRENNNCPTSEELYSMIIGAINYSYGLNENFRMFHTEK